MLSSIIIILLALLGNSHSCPFYQLTPSNESATTNYTLLSTAMVAAMDNSYCIIACDGAVVQANETLPNITRSICIMGETPVGTVFSYLTIENNITTPTFFVNASNSARIVFENINIVNAGTLFEIVGQSQLTLLNMRCWFGNICVQVQTSTTSGLVPPGLFADTATFMSNAIAILNINGWVYCNHCRFYDSITASLLTRNPSSNPWAYFVMYDQGFINCLFPQGLQYAPGDVLSPPAGLSNYYVDSTNYFNSQTYAELQSFGAAPACEPCAACPSCPSTNIVQLLFGIGLWVLIIACVATCCRRNKTDKAKKNTASKQSA